MKKSTKKLLEKSLVIFLVVFFVVSILSNINFIVKYTSTSGINFAFLWCNIIIEFVFGVILVAVGVYCLRKGNMAFLLYTYIAYGLLCWILSFVCKVTLFDIYDTILLALLFVVKSLPEEQGYENANNEVNGVKQQVIEIQPLQETGAPHIETQHEENNKASVETQSNNSAKTIVKTKIVETHQRESKASKKKSKWLSALATGLMAGTGGSTQDVLAAQRTQNGYNNRNASFETVVTFLVIYSDNSRATVETIQGDERYNKYIMYVE